MSDISILAAQSVSVQSLLVLCLVISLGLGLGQVQFKGLSLGTSGVLFAGLFLGVMGITMKAELLDFVRDFGLTLFLYDIGLQVGPSFLGSLKKQGLKLNLVAIGVIALGSIFTVLIVLIGKFDTALAVGLLSGAVTSTPALGAAQQALSVFPEHMNDSNLANLGYAVAYPGGILFLILSMIILKYLLRIDLAKEEKLFEQQNEPALPAIVCANVDVLNQNLIGKDIATLAKIAGQGVVVTRIYHNGDQELATATSVIREGDILHAVGTQERVDSFTTIVGKISEVELPSLPSQIVYRRVVVTHPGVAGSHIGDLNLSNRFGVVITRIIRAGIEFTPSSDQRIHFGDRLMLVGHSSAIDNAAAFLGDSIKSLEETHLTPIFTGIALGILVGSIPFTFPSMPAPIRLGIAGGPLLVAMFMGNMGEIGPFVAYMPNPAKSLMRDLGLALFLACVGLVSGPLLWSAISSGDGFIWMGLAALITMLPPAIMAIFANKVMKLDYVSILGILSGSMTDTAALAFASHMVKSDALSICYAAVYPLTLLVRVIMAQILVLILV